MLKILFFFLVFSFLNAGTVSATSTCHQDAVRILQETAAALAHVHSFNFAHGDVKPQNYLLAPPSDDHGVTRPLLCDFETANELLEFATNATASAATSLMLFGGTVGFCAPELCLEGKENLPRDTQKRPTKSADVFALGRTFEVLHQGDALQGELSTLVGLQDLIAEMTCHSDASARATASMVAGSSVFASATLLATRRIEIQRAALVAKEKELEQGWVALRAQLADVEAKAAVVELQQMEVTIAAEEKSSQCEQKILQLAEEKAMLEKERCRLLEPPPVYWSDRLLSAGPQRFPSKTMLQELQTSLPESFCMDWHCNRLRHAVRIVKVERMENPVLWLSFASMRAQMHAQTEEVGTPLSPIDPPVNSSSVIDARLNEVYLWHGSQHSSVQQICHQGFDERTATKRGLYGFGNYFASQACKALQYARAPGCTVYDRICGSKICSCENRRRYLLYCRVLLGEPYYASGPMKNNCRPPEHPARDGKNRYHSIVANPGIRNRRQGNQQVHREFVVWSHMGAQVYPEFLVEVEVQNST